MQRGDAIVIADAPIVGSSVASKLSLANFRVSCLAIQEARNEELETASYILIDESLIADFLSRHRTPSSARLVTLGAEHDPENSGISIRNISPPYTTQDLLSVFESQNDDFDHDSHEGVIASESLKGRRILLVEDVLVNQQIAISMLDTLGLEVEVASNGLEAVQKATANQYSAILMDCQMPVLDGYEATRQIRDLETESGSIGTPIIALTAGGDDGDKTKAFESGMTGFVRKPFTTSDLKDALDSLVEAEQTSDFVGEDTESVVDRDAVECFDLDVIENLESIAKQSDSELMKKLLEGYTTQFGEKHIALSASVQANQNELIRTSAHAIKSMAANMGDIESRKVAETLELSSVGMNDKELTGLLEELLVHQLTYAEAYRRRFNIS